MFHYSMVYGKENASAPPAPAISAYMQMCYDY